MGCHDRHYYSSSWLAAPRSELCSTTGVQDLTIPRFWMRPSADGLTRMTERTPPLLPFPRGGWVGLLQYKKSVVLSKGMNPESNK